MCFAILDRVFFCTKNTCERTKEVVNGSKPFESHVEVTLFVQRLYRSLVVVVLLFLVVVVVVVVVVVFWGGGGGT